MALTGDVQITITDGAAGAVVVPASSVQLVIGCCSTGATGTIVATRSPQTLQSVYGYGPLVEAAGLACLAGGTVLAMRATSNAAGTAKAVTLTAATGTTGGSSVMTVTGAPYDDSYVVVYVDHGGTIGTTGILIGISLDAGRTRGPSIAIGTATTYLIPQTNITLNFAAGTMITGDVSKFATIAPTFNDGGVEGCLANFQASQYAVIGVGSTHIVGVVNGSSVSAIETTSLDTMATGYVFTRAIFESRDGLIPVAYGGSGETEVTWGAAVLADFAAVSAKRALVSAGHYNMPSAFPNPAAGSPRYRRPLAWAHAARKVAVPPQRHTGRVKDGALAQIIVDPTSDPSDGFFYHDERINPNFDILTGGAGRFLSARTRVGLPGVYEVNPLLMSPLGSDFVIEPLGSVMDVACAIVHQTAQQIVNDDLRLNPNGTIFENEALAIENTINAAIFDNMTSTKMITGGVVSVLRSNNIITTKKVVITVTIESRGYVLEVDVNIGFGTLAGS